VRFATGSGRRDDDEWFSENRTGRCRLAEPFLGRLRTGRAEILSVCRKVYAGPHAPIRLVTKDDQAFATRLKQAANQLVNFAGHYIVATWGCGAECLGGAVIDARSGKVSFLPYSVCCWGEGDPFYFRKDSRLIVLSGVLNEDSPKGAHFFELRDGAFLHVTSRAKDGTALSGIPKPAR